MNELTIGDKTYISSKRAAEITGYAKDYVGQLCREGHVEAKMVGRSWYVLEESIRRHRFGEDKEKGKTASLAGAPEAPHELPSTWEAPRYSAETSPSLMHMPKSPAGEAPVARPPQVEQEASSDLIVEWPHETAQSLDMSSDRTIKDMQDAWKEWFQSRSQEPLLESPEVIEEREKEHEEEVEQEVENEVSEATPITLHKIEEKEEVVPIRPVRQVEAPVAPPARVSRPTTVYERPQTHRKGKSLIALALLLVIGGLAVVVTLIGAGFADSYVADNAIIKFIGGARTIQK